MKIKRIFIDFITTIAVLSLISAIVIVLGHSTAVKGVKTALFNFENGENLLKITNFDVSKSIGTVGVLGIIISAISIIIPAFVAFYQTKNKHFYIVLGYIIPMIMLCLPLFIKGNNIINLVGSIALVMFVNPYYTLLSILPLPTALLDIYVGFGIVTGIMIISMIVGIVYNKMKFKLD
ncbi:MAG: hypothetical protein IJW82_02915 [Clostridia bacterium]|nr:hypothetical protein [Clostridia bacterium]